MSQWDALVRRPPAPELTICTVILVPGLPWAPPRAAWRDAFRSGQRPVSPRLRLSWPPWPVLPPPPLLTGPARRLRRHAVVRFRRRHGHHPCGTRQPCRLAAAGPGHRHGAGEALTKAGVHGVVTAPGSAPGAGYLAAIRPGLQAAGMLAAVGLARFLQQHRPQGPRQPDRLEHRELGRVPREMARVADADIAGHNDG